MKRASFWWALTVGSLAAALFVLERRRPLRRAQEPGVGRVARNATIGLLAAATTLAADAPVVSASQRLARRHRLGLLRMIPLPRAVRVIVGFLLLDYTLFLWHWLNHRTPALWRFHAVHHIDRDLDTTTGVRFHGGELTLAAAVRAAQVLVIGVDRETMRIWQQLLLLSVVFHHSNVRLPVPLERALGTVVTTPRMHGIHHSTRPEELNTNYSSLLSCWDRFHGTLRLDSSEAQLTIGVTGFARAEDVTLEQSLVLPFTDDPRLVLSLLESGMS